MSMILSAKGQLAMTNHYAALAKNNGAQFQQGAAFAVTPANVQKFIADIAAKVDLMKKIQYRVVPHPEASTLSFGAKRPGHGRSTAVVTRANNAVKNSYACNKRRFNWKLPYLDIDTWAGSLDLKAQLMPLYLELFVAEQLYIALRGEAVHADPESFYDANDLGAQLRQMDEGWAVRLKALTPGNVIEGWKIANPSGSPTASMVVIFGKNREKSIAGLIASTQAAGAKTGIPLAAHGFVEGGVINVKGQAGYDVDYIVQAETTENLLVINKAFGATTFDAGATLFQEADFANYGEAVKSMRRKVPDTKRNGLECWLGNDLAAAYEQKIYGSAAPSTPSEFEFMQRVLESHGSLPSYEPADFEDGNIWVVDPAALAIYEQAGSRRREAKDDLDAEAWVDKTYYNADNVVEDPDKMIVMKNCRLLEA